MDEAFALHYQNNGFEVFQWAVRDQSGYYLVGRIRKHGAMQEEYLTSTCSVFRLDDQLRTRAERDDLVVEAAETRFNETLGSLHVTLD